MIATKEKAEQAIRELNRVRNCVPADTYDFLFQFLQRAKARLPYDATVVNDRRRKRIAAKP